MLRRLHPLLIWNRLTSTYWFLPAVVTVAAVAGGTVATAVDRRHPNAIDWLGWAYGGGADGARALLSAIAGSTITVVSVSFSVLIVALTVSSQHFGPRLLNSFMRDRTAQLVLGTFTGLFAYCLIVLRTVQGDGGDRYEAFVPHLSVTGAVVLTLFSVAMLIFYVHHVARSMQVSEITSRVAAELETAITRLFPEEIGEGTDPPVPVPPPVPAQAVRIAATSSGYLQEVDTADLLKTACRHRVQVWLLKRPGDFIVQGVDLVAAHPAPEDEKGLKKACREAFSLGRDRTSTQDAAFAIQQLVEVALRALSPGVNEPFTAVTSVDRLTQGLSGLLARRIPSALRRDDSGTIRVIAQPHSSAELVRAAFEPIASAASGAPAVIERLLESLAILAARTRREGDRDAIRAVADLAMKATGRDVDSSRSRADSLHRELRRVLDEQSGRVQRVAEPASP